MNKIKEKIININFKQLILTIIATYIFGLIAHGFCFLNANFSHDCLSYLNYSIDTQFISNMLAGRFLRPLYQIIKCNWAIPWLNGLLSLLYLSISIFFINTVLNIKKNRYIIISCALLVTCSSITLLNASYIHDTDSYSLALLFVSIGLWISRTDKSYKGHIFAIPFYILSLGLYQSYIQVAIFVYIILFVMGLLNGNSLKESTIELLKDIITVILSMIVYFAIYKILLSIFNIEEGIQYNKVTNAIESIFGTFKIRLKETFISELDWFRYPNANKQSFVFAINILLVIIAICLIIMIIVNNRIRLINIVVICLTLLFMPFAINVVVFLSYQSHALMLFPLFFCYIFIIVLLQKTEELLILNIKKITATICIIFSLLIIDNCIFSNRIYLQQDLINKNTLSTMTRIIDRIEQIEGYEVGKTKVAIVGNLNSSSLVLIRPNSIAYERAIGIWGGFSTTSYNKYVSYFKNYLGYPINLLDQYEAGKFDDYEEVQKMSAFPAKDSCKFVGDVLVIKLSDK